MTAPDLSPAQAAKVAAFGLDVPGWDEREAVTERLREFRQGAVDRSKELEEELAEGGLNVFDVNRRLHEVWRAEGAVAAFRTAIDVIEAGSV